MGREDETPETRHTLREKRKLHQRRGHATAEEDTTPEKRTRYGRRGHDTREEHTIREKRKRKRRERARSLG